MPPESCFILPFAFRLLPQKNNFPIKSVSLQKISARFTVLIAEYSSDPLLLSASKIS